MGFFLNHRQIHLSTVRKLKLKKWLFQCCIIIYVLNQTFMSMCVGSICSKAVRLRDSEAEIVDALDAFISVTATKFTNTSKVINQHHRWIYIYSC